MAVQDVMVKNAASSPVVSRLQDNPGTTVSYGVGTSGTGAQSSTLTISGDLADVP